MTTIQQDINSLTQLVTSLEPLLAALGVLLGGLIFVVAQVWTLVSTIKNGQAIQAHGADISDIKNQTNSINNALTATNQSLTERLIAANHPEGPSP
jgi:hypothetical protein